jgi:hypothetical protein
MLESESQQVPKEINRTFAQLLIDAGLIESSVMAQYQQLTEEQPHHIARILLYDCAFDLPTIVKAFKLHGQFLRGKLPYESVLSELRVVQTL